MNPCETNSSNNTHCGYQILVPIGWYVQTESRQLVCMTSKRGEKEVLNVMC